MDDETDSDATCGPDFTPVPLQRQRRNGWTPGRQRDFLIALARLGGVSAAARVVGKSARSVYTLRDRPGAESFANAWDRAVEGSFHDALAIAFDRCVNGVATPIIRRGKIVGERRKVDYRLLAAVLSGRGRALPDADEQKRIRVYRARVREEQAARDPRRQPREQPPVEHPPAEPPAAAVRPTVRRL